MNEARLAPAIEVSALLARASAEGGFGAILHKGDPDRGSLVVVLAERGIAKLRLQRLLQRDGSYAWEHSDSLGPHELHQHLVRARERDPDLWVVELDIPSVERFVAEMTA